MGNSNFDLNSLRIASPCSVDWNSMKGDERKRMCDACNLHVYDVSCLTRSEVAQLVGSTDGRLCLRLYRRADGTVLTKDCPVGLRAYQKRVARISGAVFASVLGLFSISYAQKNDKKNEVVDASKLKIEQIADQAQKDSISGSLVDPNGAVIPGAQIKLTNGSKTIATVISDYEGNFLLRQRENGTVTLEIQRPGFKKLTIKDLKIDSAFGIKLEITLTASGAEVLMGVVAGEDLIETTSPSLTTTISPRKIERLPY